MNQAGFILSGVIGIIGVITLIFTRIIQLVMPAIGRVAFQAAMVGSYNPDDYYINFSMLQIISVILIILAIILCYKFYEQENRLERGG